MPGSVSLVRIWVLFTFNRPGPLTRYSLSHMKTPTLTGVDTVLMHTPLQRGLLNALDQAISPEQPCIIPRQGSCHEILFGEGKKINVQYFLVQEFSLCLKAFRKATVCICVVCCLHLCGGTSDPRVWG
jgi:hypothetical protein